MPGGIVRLSDATATHVTGSYTSSNGKPSSENINCQRAGNPFDDQYGFRATVSTSSNSKFFSQHFIGSTAHTALSGGVIYGSNLIGANISNSATSCWVRQVKGFVCEINRGPIEGGTSAGDGCGTCNTFRISGVYVDANGKLRVYDMCEGGTKILGHTWNTHPPDRDTWYKMSYFCNTNDMLGMYHLGWILAFTHYRDCGSKTKNCTGRVRYLQPLVSENGSLYTNTPVRDQMIMQNRSWSQRNTFKLYTV